jgi:predicted metal-dependent hydrolase
MDSAISIFTLIFLMVTLFIFLESKNNDVTYVISSVDNRKYLVRNLPDKKKAADILANTRRKLVTLCDILETKYSKNKSIIRLIKNFRPDNLIESDGGSKYTSYAVNKGEKIVFCLRSRNSKEELVDENLLMFVALHELAHVMTKSIGHTEEFWNNFKFLLKHAIENNLYKKHNFRKNPEKYCGTTITDSPYP